MLMCSAAIPWLLLLLASCPGQVSAAKARLPGLELLPSLCFEDGGLAAHKGVGVALRVLSSTGRGTRVSTTCEHLAAGSDGTSRSPELLVTLNSSLPPQSYELRHDRLTGGDVNGVIYGLLDLRRLLHKLRQSPPSVDGATLHGVQRGAPAYSSRVYSIEGQYLDLPDVAYYSTAPPFLNASLVAAEAAAITRSLSSLVQNKITALVLLHPNIEDYVDYKYLGNGSTIWPTGHPHRQRSAALCPIIAKLAREVQSHGLKFYFKPYELGFPKQLPQYYPLGLKTPDETNSTRIVLQAKYKELFERTGADGIVLTAEEVHPRGGYASMALASSPATVATLATVFRDAVVTHCGKDLQMRLWRLTGDLRTTHGKPSATGTFSDFVNAYDPPQEMLYSTKEGAGDFFLRAHDNPLLNSSAAVGLRNFSVELDVFRQYEGWGSLLIWMQSWGDRMSRYHRNGVRGVGMWGDWQGSSIWPDCQPGYLVVDKGRDCTKDPVSWRIPQDRYYSTIDAFPRTGEPNRQLANLAGDAALPPAVPWRAGAATLFLAAQLAFDPFQNVSVLANEYGREVFGEANADAVAEALLATEDAWLNRYGLPTKLAPVGAYQGWTMMFQFQKSNQAQVDEAVKDYGLEACLAVDAASMSAAAKVLAAGQRVTGTAQPAVEFRRAATLTELFLRTNALYRTAYMIGANITSSPIAVRPTLCSLHFSPVNDSLQSALHQWAMEFPREGADFNIIAPSPQLVGHHTKYMQATPMLSFLNGSTGLLWPCAK